MKSRWKQYLLYGSLIIIGGVVIFLLIETVGAKNTGFETKTLWDWMELLIIPLFLAGGAFFLNRSEKENDRRTAEERAKLEREIATDRQQEAALQSYLDRMAELLLKEKLRTTKNKEVRNVGRIRTLTVLRGLDETRKGLVLRFLQESGLISTEKFIVNLEDADLTSAILIQANLRNANLQGAHLDLAILKYANLEGASLEGAKLIEAKLQNAHLEGANLEAAILEVANLSFANLQNANLEDTDLYKSNLEYADLRNTNFDSADLERANLRNANLSNANLDRANLYEADLQHANLQGAGLNGANLQDANLIYANLDKAYLQGANLQGAKVTIEQLATAWSLEGAIMPDGTKHE